MALKLFIWNRFSSFAKCCRAFGEGQSRQLQSWTTSSTEMTQSSMLVPRSMLYQPVREKSRRYNYIPNTSKRQLKVGWKSRTQSTNGKVVLIRRMMKGVSKRTLCP